MEVGGIKIRDFCVLAGKMIKIEVDLLNIAGKLEKENNMLRKIYRFCSATETAAALESIYGKLSQLDPEMCLLVTSVESNVKNSVVLEALGPVLSVAEEILPHMYQLKEKQRMLADAGKAFETHALSSGMNRLISRGWKV